MSEVKKVLIECGNSQYRRLFTAQGWELVDNIDDADLLCLTGGADVTPQLYGEEPGSRTHFDVERDTNEARLYARALDLRIPVVGICRGGQLLNVLNGGAMHQHIVGHATGVNHLITDLASGEDIMVSSTHHQMMKPGPEAEVLATCNIVKWRAGDEQDDIEVVLYPKTDTLCFQPHPEFFDPYHECVKYFFQLINERIIK